MSLFDYEFEGERKPSYKTAFKKALDAFRAGYRKVILSWGESRIELELFGGVVYGYGWIKTYGGQDMADELNRMKLIID